MAKMKSLVFFGDRELSLEEVERPTIQKNTDAVIKTVLTTICGSDLHIYHGELPVEPPFPIGHEFVGVVEEDSPHQADARSSVQPIQGAEIIGNRPVRGAGVLGVVARHYL